MLACMMRNLYLGGLLLRVVERSRSGRIMRSMGSCYDASHRSRGGIVCDEVERRISGHACKIKYQVSFVLRVCVFAENHAGSRE